GPAPGASASGCTARCGVTPWPAPVGRATTTTPGSTSSSWVWWRRASSAAPGSAEELVQEFLDAARVGPPDVGRYGARRPRRARDQPLDLVRSLGQGDVHVDAPVGEREDARARHPHVGALVEQVVGL